VGPLQRCLRTRLVQDALGRLGCRICLLKGCERYFRPRHPLSRYCSSACRAAARRWRQRCANHRYRASEAGRCRRRAQACRYRERVREQQQADASRSHSAEGYPYPEDSPISCCQRPGCYESVAKTARCPRQKFCSAACRHALRRVLVRERRWKRRWLPDRRRRCRSDALW
jgi:hypothetical protein